MLKSLTIILLTTIALVGGTSAQKSDAAILVDEFESFGCCEFRARIDAFLGDLADHPGEIGLIATVSPKEKIINRVLREEMVRLHILERKFDSSRIQFVLAEGATLQTRLFRIPVGSAAPEFPGSDNPYVLVLDKPTKLLVEYPSGAAGLCPWVEDHEVFARFFAANPTSRGRLIIRGYSKRESIKLQRDLWKYFVTQRSIDRGRIEFAVAAEDGEGFGPSTEFWYLP